jgi:hypothetical protein
MTAISATSSSSYYLTPLQQLQKELAAEASFGVVSSADASALSSALTSIDQALQGGGSSGTGSSNSSPTDMKAKIDGLIADEVSSSNLTSEQPKS